MPRRHKTPSAYASPQDKADAAYLARWAQPQTPRTAK